MKIFDSHCHLDDRGFDSDLEAVLQRADEAGVVGIMIAGIDEKSSTRAVGLAQKHKDVIASVGIHPHDAKSCSEEEVRRLTILAADPNVRAWGEIGLDYNRMYAPREDQERCFLRQLQAADDLNLPLIFHERDTEGRFLSLLRSRPHPGRRGVVHCFSGSTREMESYLELGFHIGITGILTLDARGRELRDQVVHIPRDRILVETDAPYLTPTPDRNKHRRNEPAFVKTVLHKLAAVRQENTASLAETIWENTCRLFGSVD